MEETRASCKDALRHFAYLKSVQRAVRKWKNEKLSRYADEGSAGDDRDPQSAFDAEVQVKGVLRGLRVRPDPADGR